MICSDLFFFVGLVLDLDFVAVSATADLLFGFDFLGDVFRLTDFLGEDSAEDDDCDR